MGGGVEEGLLWGLSTICPPSHAGPLLVGLFKRDMPETLPIYWV